MNTRALAIQAVTGVTTFALLLIPLYAVHADTRDLRIRGSSARVDSVSPTTSTNAFPGFPGTSGGITSSTTGTSNSGGNTGGTVVTGDQTVVVYEINEGPTNDDEETEEEAETPETTSGSACGRVAECARDSSRGR